MVYLASIIRFFGGFVCVKFLLIFLLNKNKFNLKKKKIFFKINSQTLAIGIHLENVWFCWRQKMVEETVA